MQEDGKDESGPLQWRVVSPVQGYEWDEDKKNGLEPIDMEIPVGQRPRLV